MRWREICVVSKTKRLLQTGHWWLMPVVLATQEAEIRRLAVQSQPRKIVCKTPSQKSTGGVAQGASAKKKKKERFLQASKKVIPKSEKMYKGYK
jgi:hypothetical protein